MKAQVSLETYKKYVWLSTTNESRKEMQKQKVPYKGDRDKKEKSMFTNSKACVFMENALCAFLAFNSLYCKEHKRSRGERNLFADFLNSPCTGCNTHW